MIFRGRDKTAVASFFARYSSQLKEEIRRFANSQYRLPDTGKFITMIDAFILNLPAPAAPNSILATAISLLTVPNMRENSDLIGGYLQNLIVGIRVPAIPPPPPAALPAVRADGAILADGSAASQAALTARFGFTAPDAAACANASGISASRLRGDLSPGVFYHNTVHSDTSTLGIKGSDGIHRITCIYDQNNDHFYLIGIAKHDRTERVPGKRNPVDKYKVQESLIPALLKSDTLHFL